VGRFSFYAGCSAAVVVRPSSHMKRDFASILYLIENLVVCSIRSNLMILRSISTHNLLNVLLLLISLLFFHRYVVLLGDSVFIEHSLRDLILHFNKSMVHGLSVHFARDWLFRHSIKTDAVIRAILVLVVKEIPLGNID